MSKIERWNPKDLDTKVIIHIFKAFKLTKIDVEQELINSAKTKIDIIMQQQIQLKKSLITDKRLKIHIVIIKLTT